MTQNPTPPTHDTKPTWTRFIAPLLAFLLVAGLGVALLKPKTGGDGDPMLHKPAPTFALKTMDGTTLSLDSLKGRPVVLNFWASWCEPCREEAPLLQQLAQQQKAGGLAVVGVLFNDKDTRRINDFVGQYGLGYPNLRDDNLDVSVNYGIGGVPETFFIDKGGVIQAIDRGGLDKERLAAGLKSIGVNFE